MAIIKKDYETIQTENATEYYDEVLKERAIPDPRDGLKPIHRRILWGMHVHKWESNKPHVKSAKITGSIIGKQ
ncbi:topoisomerase IV subunit A [Bacillus phage PBS1]|uniref:Topoisomerase IV subunit A n=1 Tax=Bacillus phage PBS1 TaxID=2884423 RepID=A0A223LDD3_BPPB1|nr:DNA topoisomerase II [Bacillus phage PBS1]ASU00054.1 topoisomerase IV subunit A [Bacillus phage PBS1]QXN70261.1 putative topoisomerase IV subunit A [Bacillus phage vB_BspM_Internexus]WCS68165.1 DNA gyrase subunit A [Bacillus phage vB_BsuM-Goe21]BDE75434.1 hypothetical protein [Bacillus phage PBS1]